ncbi:hypothetical protein B0H14DRAFT_2592563 [Mycena olivaceomarginata]|nr:hypothetical protein B0H14DRAFT_2592563 [Mycena olivaceomarginata]
MTKVYSREEIEFNLSSETQFHLAVTNYTTAREIYSHLLKLGVAPINPNCFYFTFDRRHLLWTDTVGSVGQDKSEPHWCFQDEPEASSSRLNRKRNTKRLDELIQAEQLDEFGNPESRKQSAKRKCTQRPENPKPSQNSDLEDMDYSSEESSSSSSDSDSDIEELANSLLKNCSNPITPPETAQEEIEGQRQSHTSIHFLAALKKILTVAYQKYGVKITPVGVKRRFDALIFPEMVAAHPIIFMPSH